MDTPVPTQQPAPQWLLDALAEGEADIAAGRTVPWDEFWARMTALMEELDTKAACNKD